MDLDDDDCECEEGAPAWMATFSDMATLLLTFFVLLLSFSTMDVIEFREALGSVKDAFGVQSLTRGDLEALSSSPIELAKAQSSLEVEITRNRQASSPLSRALRRYIKDNELADKLEVQSTGRGIVLRVRDKVFFDSASNKLRKESTPLLTKIGEMAKQFAERLTVEGHTDNRPIRTRRFPSNWELSAARAIAVMRFLHADVGLPNSALGVAGYADAQPLVSNDTPEGRSENRRVEFVFQERRPSSGPIVKYKSRARPGARFAGKGARGPGRPANIFPLPFSTLSRTRPKVD